MICGTKCWPLSRTSTAQWPSPSSGPIRVSHSVSDRIHAGLTYAGLYELPLATCAQYFPRTRVISWLLPASRLDISAGLYVGEQLFVVHLNGWEWAWRYLHPASNTKLSRGHHSF